MLTTRQWAESILLADCPYEDLTTVGLGIEETCGTVSASLKAPGIAAGIDLARETGFREVNGEFRGRSAGSVSQIMSKSAPGRVRVGEARLVPSPRIPRIEGGDAGEVGI